MIYDFGMDFGLTGRVAIVTGGSQGIGRAIALALAGEGASVVICARRREALEATASELRAAGAKTLAIPLDVTDPTAPTTLVDATLAHFGRVDVLVNNAGKGSPKPILELDPGDWMQALELNLLSAVRLSSACVPYMRAQGWGRIVNISSRVGREPHPYFASYGAAKAALMNYSKSLSNAFAKDGVLTNCVIPGLIRSEAVSEAAERSASATGRSSDDIMADTLRARPIPAGRLGEPEDVAGTVVLLCSDAASWVTGACFTVDGGISRASS